MVQRIRYDYTYHIRWFDNIDKISRHEKYQSLVFSHFPVCMPVRQHISSNVLAVCNILYFSPFDLSSLKVDSQFIFHTVTLSTAFFTCPFQGLSCAPIFLHSQYMYCQTDPPLRYDLWQFALSCCSRYFLIRYSVSICDL